MQAVAPPAASADESMEAGPIAETYSTRGRRSTMGAWPSSGYYAAEVCPATLQRGASTPWILSSVRGEARSPQLTVSPLVELSRILACSEGLAMG